MIRLLRKIRQKLLSESKYNIYILYATGEIVLVMVGILLAFQVDNWNEGRQAISIQKNSVGKLKFDLIADINRFNQLDSIYNSWEEEVDYILNEVL